MELLINENEKWNVKNPVKATDGSFTLAYDVFKKDESGAWILSSSEVQKFTFPASSPFFNLTPYEKIIFAVKLLAPEFLTQEDKLLILINGSGVSPELKTTLVGEVNKAVAKIKLLTEAEINAIKVQTIR